MIHITTLQRSPEAHRTGFTLVELLVAVGLTMLIMLMFAEIFQITTASMSTQKGIAENDQRARMATIILRNDLVNRTFQSVIPYDPSEPDSKAGLIPEMEEQYREGYFYISENQPGNDADDVLQFTSRLDLELYYGKAATLNANLFGNPNQPDFDDGSAFPDQTGASPMAEVSYFLRNGNLYRRVLLIRQPATHTPPFPEPHEPRDGADGNGAEFVDGSYAASFWNDFDYSAHFTGGASGPEFHWRQSLFNSRSNVAQQLGQIFYRFGHNSAPGPTQGQPREFVGSGGSQFIGRYAHEETSHEDFLYPSNIGTNPNPMTVPDLRLRSSGAVEAYDPATGTTTFSYENGPRRGEDILLTNVHAFDVKVWDPTADHDGDGIPGAFMDIGHSLPATATPPAPSGGDYRQANNQHTSATPPIVYGPRPAADVANNRVFDTWHYAIDLPGAPAGNEPAPFRPMTTTPGVPKQLKAIQITFRYMDTSTQQMRELVLVHSLAFTAPSMGT